MGDRTGIEWTDATWNPTRGCTRVSDGCVNCYAETMASRFSDEGQPYEGLATRSPARWTGKVTCYPDRLDIPIRWRRPRKIFVNSMSDLFHKEIPDSFIERVYATMALCPRHTFQILTKRSERQMEFNNAEEIAKKVYWWLAETCSGDLYDHAMWDREELFGEGHPWPLPNVWHGVSTENQKAADEHVPNLLNTKSAVRIISVEPMIGPVNLRHIDETTGSYFNALSRKEGIAYRGVGLDQVICGGETGPYRRTMEESWARDLRDQCKDARVAFFMKQMTGREPIPADLDIQEWPPLTYKQPEELSHESQCI